MKNHMSRKEFKIKQFIHILKEIEQLSISQTDKVACMAVKKDFTKIAAFGYNGSYPGAEINPITGGEEESLTPGESGFVHAEINMIAKFNEPDPENYYVFVSTSPCNICAKVLANAGFNHIIYTKEYRETFKTKEIFNKCNIVMEHRMIEDKYEELESLKNNTTKDPERKEDIDDDCFSENNTKRLNAIAELVNAKNKKYGNSALEPLLVFGGKTKIGTRLDDKLARVKNSNTLRVNDVVDIIGYLSLILEEMNVTIEDIQNLND